MKAGFYEQKEGRKVKCRLCPNECLIAEGKTGFCGVRSNPDGILEIPFYGKVSSVAVDPIEKKPLYHYYPGRSVLSVGFWGCSLHCPFCQNFTISQRHEIESEYLSPEDLVKAAVRKKSFGIAYTYSEPLVHIEYLLDACKIARENGIKNILVSNGYINAEPGRELLEWVDAANIDLKCFNPAFYRTELGGKLEDVKWFIREAAVKTALEVTTLIIPTKNDDPAEIEELAVFLASINKDIPLHLSCYYPTYKYTIPPTSPELVISLAEKARKYLNYVYLGNVGFRASDTLCPNCGKTLIRRTGYHITSEGVRNGQCAHCHAAVPIQGI